MFDGQGEFLPLPFLVSSKFQKRSALKLAERTIPEAKRRGTVTLAESE